MARRLFGVETEYALVCRSALGSSADTEQLANRLLKLAKARLPHLTDRRCKSIFLQNGARFYVDAGNHPEFATPECSNPWELVRYVLAGEAILADLVAELGDKGQRTMETALFKCNVDYSGTGATWGCHESYLHRAELRELPGHMIPHLVSRLVYTGAGGFKSRSAGLEFTLSPRVSHLAADVSRESTGDRGIFHTKNESLSNNGYRRLHIISGESVCSHLSSWLKVGTTALVLAMIEAGLRPGEGVELRDPLQAMSRFAADPRCRATAESVTGEGLTAIMIQRHYLALAEAHVSDPFMPEWAGEVVQQWGAMLDRLEGAPDSVATTLDWAIKLTLYRDRARRRGVTWERLPSWNYILARLYRALEKCDHPEAALPVSVAFVLAKDSPIADQVSKLTPFLGRCGLNWAGLLPLLSLRQQLFEIDWRFSQLGDRGIFSALDRDGWLDHRLRGVDKVEQARTRPPSCGRARLRGEWVRRLAGHREHHVCDWQGVYDRTHSRQLDLSDPFESEECWRQQKGSKDEEELDRLMRSLDSPRDSNARGGE